MVRHASGVYRRASSVTRPPATVRVLTEGRRALGKATLVELSSGTLRLSGLAAPAVGSTLRVALTIPERYIEFEVLGVVEWHADGDFGVTLPYLTARQAYGIALMLELRRPDRGLVALAPPLADRTG